MQQMLMLDMKKWSVAAVWALLAFFAPIKAYLLGAIALCIVDWITGVMAARKRKEEVTSRGFMRTVVKIINYSLIIIVAHIMTAIFIPELGQSLTTIAAAYVALIEFKSFCENMKVISGIDLWSRITKLIPDVKFQRTKDTRPPGKSGGESE